MSNEKFRVKFGLQVGDSAANIDATTGNINTVGDLTLGGNDIKSSTGETAITLSGGNVVSNGNIAGDSLTSNAGWIYTATGAPIKLVGNNVEITGDLSVLGNDIKSSAGATAITLSGSDTTLAGNLTLATNVIKSSSGTTAITLSGNDVNVADALTAQGTITGAQVQGGIAILGSRGVSLQYLNSSAICAVLRSTNKITTTSTTPTDLGLDIIDQEYSSIDFTIQAKSNNEYQVVKGMLLLDNVTHDTYMNIYSDLKTSGDLFTVSANIDGSNDVQLFVTSASATSTVYSCVWTGISAQS